MKNTNHGMGTECQASIRAGSPTLTPFIRAEIRKCTVPKHLGERNGQQLAIAGKVKERYDLTLIGAVEAVSPLYRAFFPLS